MQPPERIPKIDHPSFSYGDGGAERSDCACSEESVLKRHKTDPDDSGVPCKNTHDIGLVHNSDLGAAMFLGVLKGVLADTHRCFPGNELDTLHHTGDDLGGIESCKRKENKHVGGELHSQVSSRGWTTYHMFNAAVLSLRVLTNNHSVDV